MCALEVSKLHQLMAHESRVAICDDEMTLALFDWNAWRAYDGLCAKRIHQARCAKQRAIGQPRDTIREVVDATAKDYVGAESL